MSFDNSAFASVTFGIPPKLAPSYTFNGVVLTEATSFKYLGVTVTNKLIWDIHIESKQAEAYRALGLLRRTLHNAPSMIKSLAYKNLCRPKLEYAAEVWDPHLKKHIDSLEMIQSKAVRFIFNIRGRCGVTDAKDKLGLQTLENRRR